MRYLFFIIFLMTVPHIAWAAVGRQNTVPAMAKGAAVTNVSWSHTVNSGSNLFLVVGVGIDDNSLFPSSVTYNGVGMTLIDNQASGSFGASSAWGLTNPTTGTNTVQVNFGSAAYFGADSTSFDGVNQSTPTANVTKNVAVSSGFNINVTTTSGDYAYMVIGANIDQTFTAVAGTMEWQGNSFGGGSSASAAAMSAPATTTSTNLEYTFVPGGNTNTYVAFAIQQDQAGLEQEGFRFRNDDGSETTATWIAAQDTSIAQAAGSIRLRILANASGDPSSAQYQLEYKKSTDTTYKKVEAPSGSIAFGAAGAAANGTTSLSVAYPAGIGAGDLLVLAVGNKYPNNAPTTPSGWTLPPNCQGSGGQGSSGVDAGSTYATVYVKEADGTESGNLAVTIGSGNSSMGAMLRYTKGTGKSWDYACANGADNSGGAVAWSIAGGTDPSIIGGDLVIAVSAPNTDAYTYSSEAMSATGITWGAANERIDSGTASGQDCALVVSDHAVTSGTALSSPTFTMTASGSAANRPAGGGAILRIRQLDQPIQLSGSANIAVSGENTTAQLTAPSGKATSDFVTGRMQDDENPSDAVDITSADYSEFEWSITATAAAASGTVYVFRITAAGSAFGTYSVNPQWTIPASTANKSGAFITFD